ncbi:MAG TPA: MauE/DoxX family redox-associated membrane protein, partial [Chitinophagaceae bacterium]
DYSVFREQLADSPVLKPFSGFIAWALPAVEILVGILLIVPRWRLKGLWLSLGLLIAFLVYIIVMMTTSDHLPCSCGGLLEQLSWKGHIVFNSAFAVLAGIAIRLEKLNNRHVKKEMKAEFA